ncbi:hypothetical protein Efla_006843 [Eimeria flavescens]
MPHHVLAMGTVLAALGAKAASTGVDPSVFLAPSAAKAVVPSSLLALKAGKAAAAGGAVPAASSFLSHGGGDVVTSSVAAKGASFLGSKGGALGVGGAAGGKGFAGASSFLAKGPAGAAGGKGLSATGPSFAKVGGGFGSTKASLLKTSQKSCFAKKKMALKKPKGKAGKKASGAKKSKKGGKGKKNKGKGKKKHRERTERDSSSSSSNSGSGGAENQASDSGGAAAGSGGDPQVDTGGDGSSGLDGADPEGQIEAMPGALGSAGGVASSSGSGSGFLQVQQTPVSNSATTTTTPTVTTTVAPSGGQGAAITTTTASAAGAAKGAAAAAADHAADVATQGPPAHPYAGGGEDTGFMGSDDSLLDDEEDEASGSSRGRVLRSFVKGAVKGEADEEEEEDTDIVSGLSRQLGSAVFGGVRERLPAVFGLGGLGVGGLAGGLDPSDVVDPSSAGDLIPEDVDVEEEAMGVSSLLPFLFTKLSLSQGALQGGGGSEGSPSPSSSKRGRPRERRLPAVKAQQEEGVSAADLRRHSVASTACGSESGLSDAASSSQGEQQQASAPRTVVRSLATGRKCLSSFRLPQQGAPRGLQGPLRAAAAPLQLLPKRDEGPPSSDPPLRRVLCLPLSFGLSCYRLPMASRRPLSVTAEFYSLLALPAVFECMPTHLPALQLQQLLLQQQQQG